MTVTEGAAVRMARTSSAMVPKLMGSGVVTASNVLSTFWWAAMLVRCGRTEAPW